MNDTVITVEHLSKAYRIGLKEELPDTLVGAMTSWMKAPVRNFRRLQRLDATKGAVKREQGTPEDMIWALKDVSFEVKEGEVLGILGRNGAGKSVLLKILSRITEPTSGQAIIRGRVSSLLEVGTGFHPELTGRENIFLNGAILGMTKAEIARKFDEIVDFSGVEQFIDTPVKRYSSGMRMRLAFSVAANLEPEILLVDEVLAVGDIGFQKKCLGKMESVAGEGRTVLFVSHNMGAISSLCSQVILLNDGGIRFSGSTEVGIDEYTAIMLSTSPEDRSKSIMIYPENFRTDSEYRVMGLEILGKDGSSLDRICTGGYICFRLLYELDKPMPNLAFRIMILSESHAKLLHVETDPISGYYIPPQTTGKGYIDCIFPSIPLTAGTYFVNVGTVRAKQNFLHTVENAARINIEGGDVYGSGMYLTNQYGFFTCEHIWSLSQIISNNLK